MGEALISRAGGEGGNIEISNETKEILGVDNNASLDDCLQSLGLKDPNYATIIVTLKDVDGTPIPDARINMRTNTTISYTTNAIGQCLFKTNYGSATFSDATNSGYYDLLQANSVTVDCVVGSIYRAELQRRTRGNGFNAKITSNQNLKFSKFLNTINVTCVGGSGSGSSISHTFNTTDRDYGRGVVDIRSGDNNIDYTISKYTQTVLNNPCRGEGGHVNSSVISITPDTNYQCIIGKGGSSSNKHQYIYERGTLVSGFDSYYRIWFDNCQTNSFNGVSGGTTSFGGVLSALGGSGGVAGSANKPNYGGTIGGYNAYSYFNTSAHNFYTYGSSSIRVYHDYNTATGAGNNGYIWLNNFQYKV